MASEKEVVKQGWREIRGILLLVGGLVLFLSLLFYDANDISALQQPPNSPPNNLFGILGAWSAFVCFLTFGVTAYIVPLLIVALGLLHVFRYSGHIGIRSAWMAALTLGLCCMATQMEGVFEATTSRLNISGIPNHIQ